MFYLDNEQEKAIIINETKISLSRIVQGLMFVYQFTDSQALTFIQDLISEMEQDLKKKGS
jgi:hypothetical protein